MGGYFIGIIIGESLENASVLKKLKIVKTETEPATEGHKTPWVKSWTMHTVEVPKKDASKIAKEISLALDPNHSWYADFKSDTHHYIIFRNKVFYIDRTSRAQYERAKDYGVSLGIPASQIDFGQDLLQA